jgi:hypothetical protein
MTKFFLTLILIQFYLIVNAQDKGGCGDERLNSDHGGFCSNFTTSIDTVYFDLGDTVTFSYGMGGMPSQCNAVANDQIFKNNTPIPVSSNWGMIKYYSTTNPGTYRFLWHQFFNLDFTIELISNNPTSIFESQKLNQVKLYPNPTTGKFTLTLNQNDSEQTRVTVFNVTGRQILQETLTGNSLSLDLSSHPKGIYIVKINNGKKSFVERLIYH